MTELVPPLTEHPVVTRLPGIDLEELVSTAALQTRVDRKYVLGLEATARLLRDLPRGARVLTINAARSFGYESVYGDTDDLVSYRAAALRRRRRFKVRTRTYLDSGETWLEVKTRGTRGATVKHRTPLVPTAEMRNGAARTFITRTLSDAGIDGTADLALHPTLQTRYDRITLHLAGSRVTLDSNLSWSTPAWEQLSVPHLVIVETKSPAAPSAMDRLLWAHGHRPVRISKYATGLAALRPDLPATPWTRTLRRHILPGAIISGPPSTAA